jgi:hypothetical protein
VQRFRRYPRTAQYQEEPQVQDVDNHYYRVDAAVPGRDGPGIVQGPDPDPNSGLTPAHVLNCLNGNMRIVELHGPADVPRGANGAQVEHTIDVSLSYRCRNRCLTSIRATPLSTDS